MYKEAWPAELWFWPTDLWGLDTDQQVEDGVVEPALHIVVTRAPCGRTAQTLSELASSFYVIVDP